MIRFYLGGLNQTSIRTDVTDMFPCTKKQNKTLIEFTYNEWKPKGSCLGTSVKGYVEHFVEHFNKFHQSKLFVH